MEPIKLPQQKCRLEIGRDLFRVQDCLWINRKAIEREITVSVKTTAHRLKSRLFIALLRHFQRVNDVAVGRGIKRHCPGDGIRVSVLVCLLECFGSRKFPGVLKADRFSVSVGSQSQTFESPSIRVNSLLLCIDRIDDFGRQLFCM